MIHEIQCMADSFADVASGRKSFIMQKETDALYQVGDFLAINEATVKDEAVETTGRCCLVQIVYVYSGAPNYLRPGAIILGVRPCVISDPDRTRDPFRDVYEVPVYCDPELEAIT